VAQDPRRAIDLFEEACTASWAESCIAAAEMLTDGSVPPDPPRADQLRRRACDARPDKYCPP
jgi:hypothetical protein